MLGFSAFNQGMCFRSKKQLLEEGHLFNVQRSFFWNSRAQLWFILASVSLFLIKRPKPESKMPRPAYGHLPHPQQAGARSSSAAAAFSSWRAVNPAQG